MGITYDHTTINYSGSVTSKKYIVWHDTGVKGQTAAVNANYFRSVDRQSSAHYFVDKTSIYEVVAPNLTAWHCGDGNGAYGITNANSIGIDLNAGHDLDLNNLWYLCRCIPSIQEVSIGHALISDALYLGIKTTIQSYKNCLI